MPSSLVDLNVPGRYEADSKAYKIQIRGYQYVCYTPGQKFIDFFSTSCYIEITWEINNLSIQE